MVTVVCYSGTDGTGDIKSKSMYKSQLYRTSTAVPFDQLVLNYLRRKGLLR